MSVDVLAMQQIAEDLNRTRPAWVVLFGRYSEQFVAFPKCFDGPPWIMAKDSVTLAALMERAEAKARGNADAR